MWVTVRGARWSRCDPALVRAELSLLISIVCSPPKSEAAFKAKGHTIEEPAPAERADNVINLMDALRQSLGKRKPSTGQERSRGKSKRTRKAA